VQAIKAKGLALPTEAAWGYRYEYFEDDLATRIATRLARATTLVQGATATVSFAAERVDGIDLPKDRFIFRRIGNEWRVDLLQMRRKDIDHGDLIEKWRGMAKAMQEISMEIDSEQIRTSDELNRALEEQMAAMRKAATKATR